MHKMHSTPDISAFAVYMLHFMV